MTSASGDRIAFLQSNGDGAIAGRMGALQSVPNADIVLLGFLDWLDPDTVVAFAGDREVGLERSGLFRLSVSTGQAEEIVKLARDAEWQFATGLVGAPSVHAQGPPTPMDPRLVVSAAVAVLVLGAAALLIWRRRVRA